MSKKQLSVGGEDGVDGSSQTGTLRQCVKDTDSAHPRFGKAVRLSSAIEPGQMKQRTERLGSRSLCLTLTLPVARKLSPGKSREEVRLGVNGVLSFLPGEVDCQKYIHKMG